MLHKFWEMKGGEVCAICQLIFCGECGIMGIGAGTIVSGAPKSQ
jgi:hypothetical protein